MWVLQSVYKIGRKQITEELQDLIGCNGIFCLKRDEMNDALDRFASTRLDFLDCYLAALAAASGDYVATFDRDFDRFDDVMRWNPGV